MPSSTVEWCLVTPVMREFELAQTRSVFVHVTKKPGEPGNPGRLPVIVVEEQKITDKVVSMLAADRARVSHVGHDRRFCRYAVRFFYGRVVDGQWQPCRLDAGVVFGGPTYIEHGFHKQEFDERTLLEKCAAVCKWDGEMRPISDSADAASAGAGPTAPTPTPAAPPKR